MISFSHNIYWYRFFYMYVLYFICMFCIYIDIKIFISNLLNWINPNDNCKIKTVLLRVPNNAYNHLQIIQFLINFRIVGIKEIVIFPWIAHSQCVGNRSHHLVRYHAFSLFRFPSLLRPCGKFSPLCSIRIRRHDWAPNDGDHDYEGCYQRDEDCGGWEKGRQETDRARENEKEEGGSKRERERKRGRERWGKGDKRKGMRKTGNVWREQRGVARWMIARRGSIDLGNCTLSRRRSL